ncbi:hypothetical protein LAZ67_4002481 [Cordylochernes scorpioides]|uniref:Uncharacterized protein n=1 Tax=Cordylochernes scorpioides TaxID=51811 RepID=A0ABY6KD14_9ARAC|nr:hypothetical protein LAZ67_4002481 [Cordylochernes scorpioides]
MKPYLDPLLQEEISDSTPNEELVLKQRFSDPEPISGPVTRSRARRTQIVEKRGRRYRMWSRDLMDLPNFEPHLKTCKIFINWILYAF